MRVGLRISIQLNYQGLVTSRPIRKPFAEGPFNRGMPGICLISASVSFAPATTAAKAASASNLKELDNDPQPPHLYALGLLLVKLVEDTLSEFGKLLEDVNRREG